MPLVCRAKLHEPGLVSSLVLSEAANPFLLPGMKTAADKRFPLSQLGKIGRDNQSLYMFSSDRKKS